MNYKVENVSSHAIKPQLTAILKKVVSNKNLTHIFRSFLIIFHAYAHHMHIHTCIHKQADPGFSLKLV